MTTRRYLTLAVGGLASAALCLVLAQLTHSPIVAVFGVALILGVIAAREYWEHAANRRLWQAEIAIGVVVVVVVALLALFG